MVDLGLDLVEANPPDGPGDFAVSPFPCRAWAVWSQGFLASRAIAESTAARIRPSPFPGALDRTDR